MDLKKYIRSIPDYPKKGILFRDITTLIKDENAFAETINQIVERSKKYNFTKIAAIESRGFVFASAVSYILKKPFIMLRKKNKLPADVYSIDFEQLESTQQIAAIEKAQAAIRKTKKNLIGQRDFMKSLEKDMDNYMVEFNKKFALTAAILILFFIAL